MKTTRGRIDGDTVGAFDLAIGPRLNDGVRGFAAAAAGTSPSRAAEVSFLTGIGADGKLTSTSFWGENGQSAYKWGLPTLGTGATISYFFDTTSRFAAGEKATMLKAFAMWSAVADVRFVQASSKASADVLLRRGHDGGAYNSTQTTLGHGSVLGSPTGQSLISIDTSVKGFELDGSLSRIGGYGLSSIIHEVGHMLGLGHGGDYNGDVKPRTQQFSAYDDRMYSIMSYIYWGNTDAKYLAQNPVQGTDWGITEDGYERQAPHSIMQLDIEAIQQLYGAAEATPFDGGEVYGFNTTVAGPLHDFFDFTFNTDPVVTLYNQGTGNTLDLSGYADAQTIDLTPGAFSSVGGHVNNVAIAVGTVIETAIGGSGADRIIASDVASTLNGNAGDDVLIGGRGLDTLSGGSGADRFAFEAAQDTGRTAKKADTILDFHHAEGDRIDLHAIDAILGGGDDAFTFIGKAAFGDHAGELRFQVAKGDAILLGDVNGDGVADFAIHVDATRVIVAADLVL